jgi:hypothetical protein
MDHAHAAPVGTVALALTLALGVLLVAPDTDAEPGPTQQAAHLSR